jgi:hypothetical protein
VNNTKQKPTVAIGRRVVRLPVPSERERQKARLDRAAAEQARHRQELASKDAEIARLKDERHAADVETIARSRTQAAGFDAVTAQKVRNVLESKRRRTVARGETFDAHSELAVLLHEFGAAGVAPAPKDTRTAPPRTFDEVRQAREAFDKRLRELGLLHPAQGFPGSNPNGFGY